MTKQRRIFSGKKTASSINGVGKTGQLLQKNQTELLSHTIYQNKLKYLNVRPEIVKLLGKNIVRSLTLVLAVFFGICLLRQGKKKQK